MTKRTQFIVYIVFLVLAIAFLFLMLRGCNKSKAPTPTPAPIIKPAPSPKVEEPTSTESAPPASNLKSRVRGLVSTAVPSATPCPNPVGLTGTEWSDLNYYNPSAIVLKSGLIAQVQPCSMVVNFSDGTNLNFYVGPLMQSFDFVVGRQISVSFVPSKNNALAYVKCDDCYTAASPTPTPVVTPTPTPVPSPSPIPTPTPTPTPTPPPKPSPTPTSTPTPAPTPKPSPIPIPTPSLQVCSHNQVVGSPAICRCTTQLIGNPKRCK